MFQIFHPSRMIFHRFHVQGISPAGSRKSTKRNIMPGDNAVVIFAGDRRLAGKTGNIHHSIGKHIPGLFRHIVGRSSKSPVEKVTMSSDRHSIPCLSRNATGNYLSFRRILETTGPRYHADTELRFDIYPSFCTRHIGKESGAMVSSI